MLTAFAFINYIKIMTAMSVALCTQVDEPRHLNYCVDHVMECVLDGEAIEFCGGLYIEGIDTWKK